MRDVARQEVRRLHLAHCERDFPPRLRGDEINGIDMVMVDADIAGCVQVWLDSFANLDVPCMQVLAKRRDDLDRLLPMLSDSREVEYYSGLRDLAAAVLGAQRGGR